MTCSAAGPVDVALRIDAADLVEPATGSEIEPDEALEARMERLQQLCLLVKSKDARGLSLPRLMPQNGFRNSWPSSMATLGGTVTRDGNSDRC